MKNTFKKIDSRQFIMYALVVILLSIGIWFIVSNSIFLIKNLNRAFGTEKTTDEEVVQFDKEGFENLELLTER